MKVSAARLDEFVLRSDALGGPGSAECEAFWRDFSYVCGIDPDQESDPFSEAYCRAQIALYEEISGRELDQTVNEHTNFVLQHHIAASNPYNHPSPEGLATHLQRLSKAFRMAPVPKGGRVLDMGCGWGLSSELLAYLGLDVTAVDINPAFVELVNERARIGGRRIKASVSTFDDYVAEELFDAILFYECLHHAVRPWEVVRRLADRLHPGGHLVLAGEPFNSNWWQHWGMRLDALSVYCIRKFGWFESGWSSTFMEEILRQSGLEARFIVDPDPHIGSLMIGTRPAKPLRSLPGIVAHGDAEQWHHEPDHLVLKENGWLSILWPDNARCCELQLINYRQSPVALTVRNMSGTVFQGDVPPGPAALSCERAGERDRLEFAANSWIPDEELGNGDRRRLSIHLADVVFFP